MNGIQGRILGLSLLLTVFTTGLVGCTSTQHTRDPDHPAFGVDRIPPVYHSMPRELQKVVLPEYTIEPPDVLAIEGIHIVPKPPYKLRTLDVVSIEVPEALPGSPIGGLYPVEPGGGVNLGVPYGTVRISGLTVEEAQEKIREHLKAELEEPEVSVALTQLASAQQIIGQFLVAPDGTITLGSYGNVSVVGKTVGDAKRAVETHLSQFLDEPEVSLNVFAYNSKSYYVIVQGAGLGDGVFKQPVTGNETVLDAISNIQGLEQVSSKKIWIARPTNDTTRTQILPVDWYAITERAHTSDKLSDTSW